MAFWSAEVTEKEKLETIEELEEGYVLQISGASLTPAAKQGDKVFLYIQGEEDDPKFVAAVLVAGTSDYVSLNLMLPAGQPLTVSTSGAPVHLTGSIQEDPSLYGNPDFDNEDEDDEEDESNEDGEDESNDDGEGSDEEEEEAQLKLLRAKPAGSKIKEINDKETTKPAKGGKPSNDKHEGEKHKAVEEKAKVAEAPKAAEAPKVAEAPKAAKQHEEKVKAVEAPKETNGNKRPASADGAEEKSDKKPKTAPNTPASDSNLKCSCGKSFKAAGGLEAHKKSTSHK